MIQRKEARATQCLEHLKDGPGHINSTPILPPDAMHGKGRLFSHMVLEKGCGIGWHVHQGDAEAYYILRGEAQYNDNGQILTLRAGDVGFANDGEGHAIENLSDEPVEMIALILYC